MALGSKRVKEIRKKKVGGEERREVRGKNMNKGRGNTN